MNRRHWTTLAIAAANLLLVLLFPPHDYVSLQRGNIPTFDGFYFVFARLPNRAVNQNFLTLEIIVILINAAIAWLLMRDRPTRGRLGENPYQNGVLLLMAVNLVLMLLFPPMENYYAITRATLPTFDGFYFIFSSNTQRQIVTPVLYIEVILVLVNGALLWLLFRERERERASTAQMRAIARFIRGGQRGLRPKA